jgi:hypothetical protein
MEAYIAPIKAVIKPTQFGTKLEHGKTKSSLEEMINLNKMFMNMGSTDESEFFLDRKKIEKKIIHIIFTNNSLLETKDWRNKVANVGINNMAILSSDDIKDIRTIDSMIRTGVGDSGKKINYVMCCAHPKRFDDIKWLLRSYLREYPNFYFSIFLDEFDKIDYYASFIRIIKNFNNIHCIYAISATAYNKWFRMLNSCGYSEIPLITYIDDSSGYRRVRDHHLLYTDEIKISSPAENFRYILEHPDEICYNNSNIVYKIPDINSETGKIFFVPAQFYVYTHKEVLKVANEFGFNCLVLNGKVKGVFFVDGTEITIDDYKRIKEREGNPFKDSDSPMTIFRSMYDDPRYKLKEKNLVITGFNCVERGVTICLNGFTIHTAVFTPYHYDEGSKDIESIIQLVGRTDGDMRHVPIIRIMAPKYLLDMVCDRQDKLIDFLQTSPDTVQFDDMCPVKEAIPIMLTIDESILNLLEKESNKKKRLSIIRNGINDNKIQIEDKNRTDTSDPPKYKNLKNHEDLLWFLDKYELKTIRSCKEDTKQENYRFDKFIESHQLGKGYGQGVSEGEFTIDINFKAHTKGDVKIPKGIAFISYEKKR